MGELKGVLYGHIHTINYKARPTRSSSVPGVHDFETRRTIVQVIRTIVQRKQDILYHHIWSLVSRFLHLCSIRKIKPKRVSTESFTELQSSWPELHPHPIMQNIMSNDEIIFPKETSSVSLLHLLQTFSLPVLELFSIPIGIKAVHVQFSLLIDSKSGWILWLV
jgi:hypothetical protein